MGHRLAPGRSRLTDLLLPRLAAGLVVSSLPVLIMYLFLSEQFVKGMTAGALKG